ncbi:MAG: hypothetical protein RMH84_01345 [Sulfolobales archaeon]|nr:hypothetical protein [Sulfolobales archaeon]MCX8209277.1 hypothetical protein [Sulfolobales archaeon]MDW8010231.1 hypothetical protein [Sulfolobales archaeon]
MSEEKEEVEEVSKEEVSEALEEAPVGFVVDVNGLEFMIKVSDLLYEAAHSGNPSRYIEEIEKLSTSTTAAKEKKGKEGKEIVKAPKKKKPKPAVRKRKKSK